MIRKAVITFYKVWIKGAVVQRVVIMQYVVKYKVAVFALLGLYFFRNDLTDFVERWVGFTDTSVSTITGDWLTVNGPSVTVMLEAEDVWWLSAISLSMRYTSPCQCCRPSILWICHRIRTNLWRWWSCRAHVHLQPLIPQFDMMAIFDFAVLHWKKSSPEFLSKTCLLDKFCVVQLTMAKPTSFVSLVTWY